MFVTIDSPLANGPSEIFYRVDGEGTPVVHLHGGWGYEIYPAKLDAARLVIPDRTGYGRSTPIDELPPRFHEAAAIETERFLDAAWLAIAATPHDDMFDSRLAELAPPTMILHGADDPRTEPHELAWLQRELPRARFEIVEGGGHCPHAHPRTAERVAMVIGEFVDSVYARER